MPEFSVSRLSGFALELNEAMDPGWSRIERVLARDIVFRLKADVRSTPPWHGLLKNKVATYVAPNGDCFEVRFKRWVEQRYQEHEFFVNGTIYDQRTFEVRLAHCLLNGID